MNRLYNANPDGYCGDEDNGQTSAWYVFSALGFYPVCPGANQYAMGAPYFKRAVIHFENGKTMTISAEGNSDTNRYVNSMTLNGAEYTHNYLNHADLVKGGSMDYQMAATPNTNRGTAEADMPYSFSTSKTK